MEHYIYTIHGREQDPIGINDSNSWFHFYKWDTEGLVFLPVEGRYPREPVVGDKVWVNLDGNIIGNFTVHSVEVVNETIPGHASLEIWFDASKKTVCSVNRRELADKVEFALAGLSHLSMCHQPAEMVEALCTISERST